MKSAKTWERWLQTRNWERGHVMRIENILAFAEFYAAELVAPLVEAAREHHFTKHGDGCSLCKALRGYPAPGPAPKPPVRTCSKCECDIDKEGACGCNPPGA